MTPDRDLRRGSAASEVRKEAAGMGALARYFLRLGATCFGGFGAQAAEISRDLVEERGWLSRDEFLRGVAFSSLCPGPVGPQLVAYIGRIKAGWPGAWACGLAFVLPAFALTVAAAAAYVKLGTVAPFQGFLRGVSASVIAILAVSLWQLSRLTLGRSRLRWGLALAAAAFLLAGIQGTTTLILLSGVVALALERGRPSRAGAAAPGVLALFVFFLKAGALVFGTGLAILSVLRQDLVGRLGWLSEREFLDALAVGLVTPGPIVMAGAFIGYLAGGVGGAAAAAFGVFLPGFLISSLLAPSVERAEHPALKAFVSGASAAATGAIVAATVAMSRTALAEPSSIALCALSLVVLVRAKVPAAAVLLACGLAGLALAR